MKKRIKILVGVIIILLGSSKQAPKSMVGSWRGKDAGKDSDKKYDWLYMDVKKDGSFEMIDVEAANPVGKGYFYGEVDAKKATITIHTIYDEDYTEGGLADWWKLDKVDKINFNVRGDMLILSHRGKQIRFIRSE